ncbi:uncharacterized protein LOC124458257 [Xenia sp. Carnegie-2017]|uniref:uncharacterized protein LOC124458257 n=1 Tax=Xenia sp. Carnegie-2017 TaxID=2897299 RepID=UPI001F04C07B|nr:uncharacterized protein LOC124458257 [Xenia sp. Carnegie-2017]
MEDKSICQTTTMDVLPDKPNTTSLQNTEWLVLLILGASQRGDVSLIKSFEADETNLKEMFRSFGLTLIVCKEFTASEIINTIDDILTQNESIRENFLLIFIGYGDRYGIRDCHFQFIDFQVIINAVTEREKLKGKNKLFMMDTILPADLFEHRKKEEIYGQESDTLIAIASIPESISVRGSEGTLPVIKTSEIFRKHFREEDVSSMMLRVNYEMRDICKNEGYLESPGELLLLLSRLVKLSIG